MIDPMMTPNCDPSLAPVAIEHEPPLVLSLAVITASMVPVVGGKAAALGDLLRSGFPVPDGFCVTTTAYDLVTQTAGLERLLDALADASGDAAQLQQQAAVAREALLAARVPDPLIAAIRQAVQIQSAAAGAPVAFAVRSSGTAEDLPWASFAGQQETYLNVVGEEAVLDAVRRCFASLWTDRAVAYRANLGIDPRTVRLAVVVQRLVDAAVAGVLFTANPLTGRRREAVIEANPGLGEAVVSGASTPDHFVIATPSGEIVERHLGDKRLVVQAKAGGGIEPVERPASDTASSLSDEQVRALAALGARVEAHVGAPQDVEWALDAEGRYWLLQARPITTLYPLPLEAPSADDALHVYMCFGVQQGTTRPFTPMGVSAIRLLASGLTTLMGLPPSDPLRGPRFVVEAGSRVFLDVTRALRSAFGRRLLMQMMSEAEVRAATDFQQLSADPRLALLPARRGSVVRAVVRLSVGTRLPWYLVQALFFPRIAQARVRRLVRRARRAGALPKNADAAAHLRAAERLLLRDAPRLLPQISPVMVAGMQAFSLARRLLGGLATEEECQRALRGSSANPTVQMNLALWALAEQIAADSETARLVRKEIPAELAADYQAGRLPGPLQRGLATFLATWGQHAVAELDVGLPRWSEDPAAVLTLLAGYLGPEGVPRAPLQQVERVAREAEATIHTLTRRARTRGWLRARLVSYCLRRAHTLSGYREMPRFAAALLLAQARLHLCAVGSAVAQAGDLERAEDIFFLTLAEARQALSGSRAPSLAKDETDWRALVRERRAHYEEEVARRHVPLVLLSDGTEPTTPAGEHDRGAPPQTRLQGNAASPGVATGPARVIYDPAGALLEPGEILVAPSTDPGWTPLFLKAGGLVMELGGAMAHGAIVAREYGLPAVVGVSGATERIVTGQRITVDGAAGVVVLEPIARESGSDQ